VKVAVSRELALFQCGATRARLRDWSDGGCATTVSQCGGGRGVAIGVRLKVAMSHNWSEGEACGVARLE